MAKKSSTPAPVKRLVKASQKKSKGGSDIWQLRLYIAGKTPKSMTALANLKKYCAEHLEGRYTIEIIDLLVNPQLAAGDQILAIPTLVRKMPVPVRKIIGDLSNRDKVIVGLDLRPLKSLS